MRSAKPLTLIAEEGLEQRLQRHYRGHKRLVKGLEEMGLSMHVPEQNRIWNLNTPRVPEGVNDANVRARLLKDQGIEIAGGFGPLAGKVFRIGIMGPLATDENVDFFLNSFRSALVAEGYKACKRRLHSESERCHFVLGITTETCNAGCHGERSESIYVFFFFKFTT